MYLLISDNIHAPVVGPPPFASHLETRLEQRPGEQEVARGKVIFSTSILLDDDRVAAVASFKNLTLFRSSCTNKAGQIFGETIPANLGPLAGGLLGGSTGVMRRLPPVLKDKDKY